MAEQVMGLAEAAAQLRIPYQDAHRLLLTGRIRGEKRGGRWFVLVRDVEKLAQQREREGVEPRLSGALPRGGEA